MDDAAKTPLSQTTAERSATAPAPVAAPQAPPQPPAAADSDSARFEFGAQLGKLLAGLLKHDSNEKRFDAEHAAQVYRDQVATIERLHQFDARNEQIRWFVYVGVATLIGCSVLWMAGHLITSGQADLGTSVLSHAAALITGLLGGRGLKGSPTRAPAIPDPPLGAVDG